MNFFSLNLFRQIYLTIIFIFAVLTIQANIFGGTGPDAGYHISKTYDGGYILCGDYGNITTDIFVIKIDSCGNLEWSRTLGDLTKKDHANCIAQTPDSGYIIMGTYDYNSPNGQPFAWLLRLNEQGDTLWTRKYSFGQWADWGLYAYVKRNGHFILGMVSDGMLVNNPTTLFETDTAGNIIWNSNVNISSIMGGYPSEFYQTSDSSTITATTTIDASYSITVAKVNSGGASVFLKSYTDTSNNLFDFKAYGVCETPEGGCMVAGSTNYYSNGTNNDFYYMKLNSSGDSLWSKHFGGMGIDELQAIRSLPHGGYIMAGNTTSFGSGGNDIMLVRLNGQGDTIWTRTYGGPGNETLRFLELARNGGFIMIGDTSDAFNFNDVWLLITDSLGNIIPNCNQQSCFDAYYPFNGNAADSSGYGNDGIVYGPALTTDRFLNPDSAYDFNGVDNYIEVPNSPTLQFFSNEQSVCFWMQIPSIPNPMYQEAIIEKLDQHLSLDSTGESAQGFTIVFAPDGRINYAAKSGASTVWAQSDIDSSLLSVNQYMFICFTNDGDSVRSYLNGNKINTDDIINGTAIGQNNVSLLIGKDRWTSNGDSMDYFLGKLDDIRLYNCALSDSEITLLYGNFSSNINEASNGNLLNIFPNPAKDIIKIDYPLDKSSDVNIEIYNSIGEKIKSFELRKQKSGKHVFQMNVKEFGRAGIYFVKFITNNKIMTGRLVILR